ncbi:carbon-monoxide dehydrogenase medium subunit [Novosphingobium sp. PhB165]|uniref:FAD binding domain-containing protein n=1 Tax=Novosphingobium sp. PhB165 TaxID=2485105 RepID=UPI00104E768B|nr:xanthine dehydrogenase family protein subunit M [Novosphingobium sp. PhB165]TCM20687.1 carbon-monoxide dehydrogenase medium subunit [Novosphingobium sp. PhB165]
MKPAPFDYVRPASIDEACTILSEAGGGATVIAGGQTLVPLLNLRMSQPFVLVDIGAIPELRGVDRVVGGIRVGPMTRQADALEDQLLAQHLPAFVRALSHVGHHQTRNRGTIGGSVALGEPAAEMPATAVALGAEIEIASIRGTRRVPAEAFYLGPYMTVLEPDELVTGIIYPDWPQGHLVVFQELAQRPGDFALVGMVGALVIEGGLIQRVGLSWFGMGPTPMKMRRVEAELQGKAPDALDLKSLSRLAVSDAAPFDDHHASAEYRRTVGGRMFTRSIGDALALGEVA